MSKRKTTIVDRKITARRSETGADRRYNLVRCFRDARKTTQIIERNLTLTQAKSKVCQNSLWQDCYQEVQ